MIEPNTPQSRWLQAQNLARAARKVLAAARSFPTGRVPKVDSAIMDLRAAFAALDHIAAAMGVDSRMERVAVHTAMSNVENALKDAVLDIAL